VTDRILRLPAEELAVGLGLDAARVAAVTVDALAVGLPEVSTTFDALTTMTWSPVSMCGAKVGLCLPRSTRAISVHMRPSTRPSASTTYQSCWISLAFGE
jgi:hypothetical protein